jgi:hypothetical protein
MRVLFVGDQWIGSNARSFSDAFRRCGHDVTTVDPHKYFGSYEKNWLLRLLKRLNGRYPLPWHVKAFNDEVLAHVSNRFDLLFVFKGNFLLPKTLKLFGRYQVMRIHFHPDDAFNSENVTDHLVASIPLYECHLTPKTFNVSEFIDAGAKRAYFVPYAFDSVIHLPSNGIEEEFDTVFIGAYRKKRAEMLEKLVEAGFSVRVWGWNWHRLPLTSRLRSACTFQSVTGSSLSAALSRGKIALCFLNHENRDLHTARTYEIPACRVFMLAERTSEHLSLLPEGICGAYFDGNDADDLCERVAYFLWNEKERMRIREAAYSLMRTGHHSYEDRVRYIESLLSSEGEIVT